MYRRYLNGVNSLALTSFVFLIPVVALVALVMIVAGVRGGSMERGDEMLRNIYIYLVLFATLMMTIGGSVGFFMAAADIIAPGPSYHMTFEEYRQWGPDRASDETLSEAELRERYDRLVTTEEQRRANQAMNTLVKSLAWIIVPLPVFLLFQRHLRKRESDGESPTVRG